MKHVITCGLMAAIAAAVAPPGNAQEAPTDNSRDKQIAGGSPGQANGFFVGVGVGLTHNIGGARATDFNVTQLDNGQYFVQVKESEDTDIRIIVETHYLTRPKRTLGSLVGCGPFALGKQRCGPFVAAALSPNAEVVEFGAGWMIGMGDGSGELADGFAVGIGVLVDPDSFTIDGYVVDPQTRTIREEYVRSYLDDELDISTKDSTMSFLFLMTKSF